MKNLAFILIFSILYSCSEVIDKPKTLISEDKMAELIADFAINNQMDILNQNGNLEASALYILQKHKVTAKDFRESQTYYMTFPKKMEKIYNQSQEILLEKYPDLENDIQKKIQAQPPIQNNITPQ